MKIIYIYAKEDMSEDEIHDYLAEKLNFPDYYGRNLSALYDLLTEMTEAVRIDFVVGKEMCRIEAYLRRMYEVLCDVAEENPNIKTDYIIEA